LQARSNGEEQRDGAAASAHDNGRRPYAALQRWKAAKIFCFFLIFFIRQFQESKKEKKGRALKHVSRLWWLA